MSNLKTSSAVKYESEDVFNESNVFNGTNLSNNLFSCSLQYVCLDCLCCFNQNSQNQPKQAIDTFKSETSGVNDKIPKIVQNPPIIVPSNEKDISNSTESSSRSEYDHSPNIAQRRRHILLPKIQTKFINEAATSDWYETDDSVPNDQSVIQLKSFQVQPKANETIQDIIESNCRSPNISTPIQNESMFEDEFNENFSKTYFSSEIQTENTVNFHHLLCTRRRSTIEISNRPDSNRIDLELWNKRNTSSQEDIFSCRANTIHIGSDCPRKKYPYSKTNQNLAEEKELATASNVIELNGTMNTSKYLMEEFTKIPTNIPNIKHFKGIDLKLRNRHTTNIPIEETRIHLPPRKNEKKSNCVYINANFVKGHPKGFGDYIATQGPLPCTVNDFWQLAWHSKTPVILMLTELCENKINKCELYLPTLFGNNNTASMGHSSSNKPISVVIRSDTEPCKSSDDHQMDVDNTDSISQSREPENVSCKLSGRKNIFSDRGGSARHNNHVVVDIECTPGAQRMFGDINVKIIDLIKHDTYSVREIILTCETQSRRLYHIWMPSWKDHSGGPKSQDLFDLIRETRKIRQFSQNKDSIVKDNNATYYSRPRNSTISPTNIWSNSNLKDDSYHDNELIIEESNGPMIVHCSAGLGRTGCFIAIDIGIDQIIHEKNFDVMKTVSRMRLQRGGLVETFEQYEYIYQTLLTLSQDHSMFENLNQEVISNE